MTETELRDRFEKAYKIIRRERKMRERVLAGDRQRAAMAEMDLLLEIVTELKDELKRYVEREPEQGRLLDAPERGRYP